MRVCIYIPIYDLVISASPPRGVGVWDGGGGGRMKAEWKQNGNIMEAEWKQNGSRREAEWTQNGSRMETECKHNVSRMVAERQAEWKQN